MREREIKKEKERDYVKEWNSFNMEGKRVREREIRKKKRETMLKIEIHSIWREREWEWEKERLERKREILC